MGERGAKKPKNLMAALNGLQIAGPLKNVRWERFVLLLISGKNAGSAYRECYGVARASAEVAASRLLRNAKVSERIGELQIASATMTTLNMQQRREILGEIANDAKAKPSDRIAAVMADAKLAGELTEKQEVTQRGDPDQPLMVHLPKIIYTARAKRPETQTMPICQP